LKLQPILYQPEKTQRKLVGYLFTTNEEQTERPQQQQCVKAVLDTAWELRPEKQN
jgi:hypothetical protein